ncbi:MAG: TRAM domain-containing protein [Clostridia bacterium]|nr:TRAM domain-containing protein [Clostridia bacterium]
MFIKTLKIILSVCGGITGFTIVVALMAEYNFQFSATLTVIIYIFTIVLFTFLVYFLSGKILIIVNKAFGKAEKSVSELSLYEVLVSFFGLLLGLIIANLIAIPLRNIDVIGGPIAVVLNIFFGLAGMYLLYLKREEITFSNFKGLISKESVKLVDSCVLIDGRLNEVVKTGFIKGPFLIPTFILMELQILADNNDTTKRSRGKRGLELLEMLKKESANIIIKDTEFDRMDLETDVKLIKYAQKHKYTIITLDYNLNKVAGVTGIKVLNLNDLSSSLKMTAIPGESMIVDIQKQGKEFGQGIGYLEDGTMVIIENGKDFIGMTKEVIITTVTQTSAGRLIFTKVS